MPETLSLKKKQKKISIYISWKLLIHVILIE